MDTEADPPTCSICFEKIGNTDQCQTECKHVFHTSCLLTHAVHNLPPVFCPLCRTPLTPDTLAMHTNEASNSSDAAATTVSDAIDSATLPTMETFFWDNEIPFSSVLPLQESARAVQLSIDRISENACRFFSEAFS